VAAVGYTARDRGVAECEGDEDAELAPDNWYVTEATTKGGRAGAPFG
jgi:hypothetical protein